MPAVLREPGRRGRPSSLDQATISHVLKVIRMVLERRGPALGKPEIRRKLFAAVGTYHSQAITPLHRSEA